MSPEVGAARGRDGFRWTGSLAGVTTADRPTERRLTYRAIPRHAIRTHFDRHPVNA